MGAGDTLVTTFSAALDRLVAIEQTVSITSPTALTIQKAHKYAPPALNASDMPVVINGPHFEAGALSWGMGRQELHMPTLIRVVAGDMTSEVGAEIVHEFLYAILDKLILNQKLNDSVTKILGVSVGPIGGLEYPAESGLIWQRGDLVVDLVFEEGKAFASHTA